MPEADRARIPDDRLRASFGDQHSRFAHALVRHQTFIQFHLELDGNLTLIDAHTIADAVMRDVERAFPNAEVLIHEDPYGIAERRAKFV